MNTETDDEELVFDEEPTPAAKPREVEDKPAEPAAAVPESETPAAPAEAAKAPAAEPAPKAAETPAAPAKRSRTGMAVATGFALCIVASAISAVQAWRAANIVAHANEGTSDSKALAARLNNIEKLLEQQRTALDALSANPNAPITAASGDSQINALAAAVRANQEMNERLPAMIMQQVDSRLARASQPSPRPAVTKKPTAAAAAKPKPKPTAKPVAIAKAAVPVVQVKSEPPVAEAAKRPAGEAIRYP